MAYELEEKQYEIATNGELWRTRPTYFTPGQVLEGLLGFDIAGTPDGANKIWALLKSGVPTGIQLIPNLWPIGARPHPHLLPTYAVSLILQYKRSEHIPATARQAKQYPHWKSEFYRYSLTTSQHSTLLQLEAAVGNMALMRYAAPVFHTYRQLEQHQLSGRILDNSNFVSPTAIGATHSTWSFVSPGGAGWANAGGEEVRSETWVELEDVIKGETIPIDLAQHLSNLAGAAIRLRLSSTVALPKTLELSATERIEEPATISSIVNLCHVARAMSLIGSSWWIALLNVNGAET